jgi:hypothetical protein
MRADKAGTAGDENPAVLVASLQRHGAFDGCLTIRDAEKPVDEDGPGSLV